MKIRMAVAIAWMMCLAGQIDAAQTGTSGNQIPSEPAATTEPEVTRYERELASRLVDVTKAEQLAAAQRLLVEQLHARVELARESGDEAEIEKAEQEHLSAKESLASLEASTVAAKELYDQAKTKFEISKKNAELESKKSEPPANGQPANTPLDGVLMKRHRVAQATEEAELAQRKTLTLRQQLETLLNRQQEIRRTSDRLSERLSGSDAVSGEERKRLWDERQEYVEGGRRVAEEIQQLREEILVAEATQRIKEESAQEESDSFGRWKADLLTSAVLFLALLSILLVIRLVVARRIQEPSRKYFINKVLSLLTTVLLIVGLAFIFADHFANLLTLFGLAVAGITIALQEVVASFAAWFFIRTARGFRTGDWIQLGDHFGEVIDIGFLRTTLKQHLPFANDGRPDGGLPTGGLIVLMNNTVFKNPLINYSREFPFIWCALRYNITFESNWERAREVLLDAMRSEAEINDTARQAKEYFEEMAGSYSIRVDPTDPVVRCWTSGVGVELTARFLTHPRRRPHLIDAVNLRILRDITQSDDMRFAYWTVRSIATPATGLTTPQNQEVEPDGESRETETLLESRGRIQ